MYVADKQKRKFLIVNYCNYIKKPYKDLQYMLTEVFE